MKINREPLGYNRGNSKRDIYIYEDLHQIINKTVEDNTH